MLSAGDYSRTYPNSHLVTAVTEIGGFRYSTVPGTWSRNQAGKWSLTSCSNFLTKASRLELEKWEKAAFELLLDSSPGQDRIDR